MVFPIWKLEPMTQQVGNGPRARTTTATTSPTRSIAPRRSPTSRALPNSVPNAEYGDPRHPLFYRVYLTVRRDGLTYGYPSETVLNKMFGPLKPNGTKTRGLAMNYGDFMREGERIGKYIPSHECEWY